LYKTDKYTALVCVDEKLQPVVETSRMFLVQYVALLLIGALIASFIGMSLIKRAMVNPINRMAESARNYEKTADKYSDRRYFDNLDINTGDEIERLATTLKKMEESVNEYMAGLTEATAEKERINTELSLAARIQMSMLTTEFPERKEFRMHASMEPAKEVGGDFYDAIDIDDDHIALVIADVSGKGIPAALFMMATKIMLADGVKECMSPARILTEANDKICEGNEQEMFVTVWLGILEISTGKITACNAGHEYPVVVHPDGSTELLHDKHGFVIGGLPGMKYTDYEISLEPGEKLFLYTDGATEATSLQGELLGTGRIMAAIEKEGPGISPEETIYTVRETIRGFTLGTEQFDDLTMLCLEYRK
jgi:sigma-B regulation protein RsbU (phosphoserine phosphatase)